MQVFCLDCVLLLVALFSGGVFFRPFICELCIHMKKKGGGCFLYRDCFTVSVYTVTWKQFSTDCYSYMNLSIFITDGSVHNCIAWHFFILKWDCNETFLQLFCNVVLDHLRRRTRDVIHSFKAAEKPIRLGPLGFKSQNMAAIVCSLEKVTKQKSQIF